MKLHTYLKKARKELGFTQEQMAEFLELPLSLYSFIEYGEPLWETESLIKYVEERRSKYDELHSS
jgi:transcriptional regulator with XRE-family HTH domain